MLTIFLYLNTHTHTHTHTHTPHQMTMFFRKTSRAHYRFECSAVHTHTHTSWWLCSSGKPREPIIDPNVARFFLLPKNAHGGPLKEKRNNRGRTGATAGPSYPEMECKGTDRTVHRQTFIYVYIYACKTMENHKKQSMHINVSWQFKHVFSSI